MSSLRLVLGVVRCWKTIIHLPLIPGTAVSPIAQPTGSTNASQSITVSLGDRSYNIRVCSGQWNQTAEEILAAVPDISHVLVITDAAIASSWTAGIVSQLRQSVRCEIFEVPSGEPSKSTAMVGEIWEWMHASAADRKTVVIAIGGGVVGDLAGFAAASYARGLRLIQIPTTLLAQVDSSVGGKTGINLEHGKNMVGAFWQPSLVWIDTETLTTLADRPYLSGLGEVIKYGVIEDADFFSWLESNAHALVARDPVAIRYAIHRSCQIKANVVGDDERETSGRRAILNYGHTFAHAIEATAGYGTLLHGEAVAIGMNMAAQLSLAMGLIDKGFIIRQRDLIEQCSLPATWPQANGPAMVEAMKTDKKVAHASLRFILPDRLGHVEMITCNDTAAICAAVQRCV